MMETKKSMRVSVLVLQLLFYGVLVLGESAINITYPQTSFTFSSANPPPANQYPLDLNGLRYGPPTVSLSIPSGSSFDYPSLRMIAIMTIKLTLTDTKYQEYYDFNWIQGNMTFSDFSRATVGSTLTSQSVPAVEYRSPSVLDTHDRFVNLDLWEQTPELMEALGPFDPENPSSWADAVRSSWFAPYNRSMHYGTTGVGFLTKNLTGIASISPSTYSLEALTSSTSSRTLGAATSFSSTGHSYTTSPASVTTTSMTATSTSEPITQASTNSSPTSQTASSTTAATTSPNAGVKLIGATDSILSQLRGVVIPLALMGVAGIAM